MRIEDALNLVQKEYEKSKDLEFVRDPVAYSLYKVWKLADADKRKRVKMSASRVPKGKNELLSEPLEDSD